MSNVYQQPVETYDCAQCAGLFFADEDPIVYDGDVPEPHRFPYCSKECRREAAVDDKRGAAS